MYGFGRPGGTSFAETDKNQRRDFRCNMTNKQVHADLGEEEFQALVRAVQLTGLSLGEAVRQATLAWVAARVPEAEPILAQAQAEIRRPVAPLPRADEHMPGPSLMGTSPARL